MKSTETWLRREAEQKLQDMCKSLGDALNHIEAVEAERDEWFRKAKLAEEWRDSDKDRAEAAEAKLAVAVRFLESASKQKTSDEVEYPMDHDWRDGFDLVVADARAALTKIGETDG